MEEDKKRVDWRLVVAFVLAVGGWSFGLVTALDAESHRGLARASDRNEDRIELLAYKISKIEVYLKLLTEHFVGEEDVKEATGDLTDRSQVEGR